MPVVKTESRYFLGVKWKMQVRCNQDGIFRIKMPDRIRNEMGVNEVSGKTINDAMRSMTEKLDEFSALQTTERKVIIYNFQATAYITAPDPDPNAEPDDYICVLNRDDISFCEGMAMSLTAGVFIEYATARSDGKTSYRYEPIESSIPWCLKDRRSIGRAGVSYEQPDKMLDWTEKRELFFRRMGESFANLILGLDKLTDTNETLLSFADSGKKIGFDEGSA